MMAVKIFKEYISCTEQILALAEKMLSVHISDKSVAPDNSRALERKRDELDRMESKRVNLIDLRTEGDIDKGFFKTRKAEFDAIILKLQQEIVQLESETPEQVEIDYSDRFEFLKERLASYVEFNDEHRVPENIVEAFISKIIVSKDEFKWYLRLGENRYKKEDPNVTHMKIGEFVFTIADAKKYVYSISTSRRVYNWKDIHVSLWI